MKVTVLRAEATTVLLRVAEVGHVQLRRFGSADHPSGRPWHIVCFGLFFPSPDDCVRYLEQLVPGNEQDCSVTYTGYGANTHAPSGN